MTQRARRAALGLTAVALLALGAPALTAQSADPATALSLTSTAHPPLPADPESVWISPTPSARAAGSALTRGVAELAEGAPMRRCRCCRNRSPIPNCVAISGTTGPLR